MKINHNLSNNLKVNTAKVVLKRLSQQTVKKYQKLEVDEENVCEMCNASFTTPMTLSKHIKLVHVEKELNMLKQLMKLNNDYKQITMQMKNQLLQFCKSHNVWKITKNWIFNLDLTKDWAFHFVLQWSFPFCPSIWTCRRHLEELH